MRLILLTHGGRIHSLLLTSTTLLDGSAREMVPLPRLLEMFTSTTSRQLITFSLVSKYLSLMNHVKDALKSTEVLLLERLTIPSSTSIGPVLMVSLPQELITS